MQFIPSTVFASLRGSILFLATSAILTIKTVAALPVEAAEHEDGPPADVRGPSWSFFNPEMDQIMADLKVEKDSMTAKEKQLTEMANRIASEKAELEESVRSVKRMQDQVDRSIIQIKADEITNLKRLAKMYGAMEPPGAARILKEIDDAVIVKVLTLMKEPETAVILEAFASLGEPETKRAATIAEALRIATSAKPAPKP